jgi:hypothetical protein
MTHPVSTPVKLSACMNETRSNPTNSNPSKMHDSLNTVTF